MILKCSPNKDLTVEHSLQMYTWRGRENESRGFIKVWFWIPPITCVLLKSEWCKDVHLGGTRESESIGLIKVFSMNPLVKCFAVNCQQKYTWEWFGKWKERLIKCKG